MATPKPRPAPIADVVKATAAKLSGDAGDWLYAIRSAVWEGYGCDAGDRCPNQPAWDKARGDMFDTLATTADRLLSDMIDELVGEVTVAFEAYAIAHPDAPRAVQS